MAAPATRVVTVSATYGAGGTVVAPLLAERLGLAFADRLGPWPGPMPGGAPPPAGEADRDAEPTSSIVVGLELLSTSWNIPAPVDPEELPGRVRAHVETGIRALLERGAGVVILGRAGAFVLRGDPRAFHVRLDGPIERRARRGAAWEGITLQQATARLRETDESRARYAKRLYGRDPADSSLYHLVVDSTAIGVEACVTLIAAAAAAYWSYDDDDLDAAVEAARARRDGSTGPSS